jgi:hypothetical protein
MIAKETTTSELENQLAHLIGNSATQAVRKVLDESPLERESIKGIIEQGDDLKGLREAIYLVVSGEFSRFLETKKAKKASVLIKTGGLNSYFEEQVDYWREFWKRLGIREPDFSGISPFIGHVGYYPLLVPKNNKLTAQWSFGACKEKFHCHQPKDMRFLDDEFIKNVHDPRVSAYTAWYRDCIEADDDSQEMPVNASAERNITGITLFNRLMLEYEYSARTRGGHLDMVKSTMCTGSHNKNGLVPRVYWHKKQYEIEGLRIVLHNPRIVRDRVQIRREFFF